MKILNPRRATDPPWPSRTRVRRAGPLAGAIVSAILIAGCGGGSSGGIAHLNTSTSAKSNKSSTKASRLAYSQCMRSHGVPNLPDGSSSGGPGEMPAGINPNSSTFQSAERDCKSLEPAGILSAAQSGKAMSAALEFATCMQKNGVPNYPDPKTTNNGAAVQQPLGSGVDPNSPAFQRAQKKCGKGISGAQVGGS
jgi:hypothetical protein